MAVGNITNVHTLSHISNSALAASDDVLSQLSNVNTTPGIDLLVSSPSGNVFPSFLAAQSQNPEVSFDTTQVLTVLTNTGVTMVDLTAQDSVLYFEKSSNLAVRAAGTVHTTLTMPNTALICNQITAGHRTPAVASCRLLNVYDGTNAPVTIASNSAMAGTKVDAQHYVLGGVSINGAFLTDGVQSVTVDFGQEFFGGAGGLGADGTNYTTFFGINTIKPVITIQTHNLGWATYGLNGTAQSAVIVYFRKILTTGPDIDANATAISLTGTTGLITVDNASGGGTDAATGTIRLTQNATLVLNTTDAITAT